MKIMLMGPPASGKGTVGALLSQKLDLPIFSVGELLREIPETSLFYKPLHEYMDKGELAPDSISAGVIREELKDPKYKNGYILDGWMRNMEQKDSFDPEVDFAILIDVSPETSIKRIGGRSAQERKDDKQEIVEKRLELFKMETLPVVDYYKQQGNLIEVDGEGTPEEVLSLILTALKNRDSN